MVAQNQVLNWQVVLKLLISSEENWPNMFTDFEALSRFLCMLAVPLPCTHLTSTNTNPSIFRRANGRCDDVRCGGGDGGCPGVGAFSPSAGSFYAGGVYNSG